LQAIETAIRRDKHPEVRQRSTTVRLLHLGYKWLPTYCSDLNPIERFWRHLKDLACANKLQGNIENMMCTVNKVLSEQNDLNSCLRFHVPKNL
jgi:hypothetical protein